MDECAEDISECSQACTNTNGSYGCSCYLGYQASSSNNKFCIGREYRAIDINVIYSSVCYTTEIAHVRFAQTNMHQSLYIRYLALYRLPKTCAPSALSDKS